MDLPSVLVHKVPGVESKIRMLRGSLGNSPQHVLKQTLREDSAPRERKQGKGHSSLEVSLRGSGVRKKPGNLEKMFPKGTMKRLIEVPTSDETVPTQLEEQEWEGG